MFTLLISLLLSPFCTHVTEKGAISRAEGITSRNSEEKRRSNDLFPPPDCDLFATHTELPRHNMAHIDCAKIRDNHNNNNDRDLHNI